MIAMMIDAAYMAVGAGAVGVVAAMAAAIAWEVGGDDN